VIALVELLLHQTGDPAAAVERMIAVAPDLSHALGLANRFGTFASREDRSPERELLDEASTTRVMDDIRGRVRRASAAELREERDARWLLAGLLIPDEHDGQLEVAAKAADGGLMRALVRQSFGWVYRSNDFGTSRMPQLDWDGLMSMLGRDVLEQRVRDLAPTVEPVDEEERMAWDLAKRYAGGEQPPRFP